MINIPLLKADAVCSGYGGTEIVHSASFEIAAGQRVSIIGANGCGKTTLLKTLCGLIPLMHGDVIISGKSVKSMTRNEIAGKMSMMAQSSEYWFDFSVMDTVLMGRYSKRKGLLSTESSEDRRIAEACLKSVGMLDLRDRLITELSGGQRQRVLLARAFAQEPQIIILDEPTNHLDLKHQVELFEYLHEWVSRSERIVIQVMHDLNLARLYSDRILLMNNGVLTANGVPSQVMNPGDLNEAYGFDISAFMLRSLTLWEDAV